MATHKNHLHDMLISIADVLDSDPLIHFSHALEIAQLETTREQADMAGTILRLIQLGLTPIEALQRFAVKEDLPALTAAVQLIADTEGLITSKALRRVADHLQNYMPED